MSWFFNYDEIQCAIKGNKAIISYARKPFRGWGFIACPLLFLALFDPFSTVASVQAHTHIVSPTELIWLMLTPVFLVSLVFGLIVLVLWATRRPYTCTIDPKKFTVEMDRGRIMTVSQFKSFEKFIPVQTLAIRQEPKYFADIVGEGHAPVYVGLYDFKEADLRKRLGPIAQFLSIPVGPKEVQIKWRRPT